MKQTYINFCTLLCCATFISSCVSLAPSLTALDKQSKADGQVLTVDVNKSFKTTVNEVAKQMRRCLAISYSLYEYNRKISQKTTSLKSKRLGPNKIRLFMEVEQIHYSLFFDDEKDVFYYYMVDIQKLSSKKTRVTSKMLNTSLEGVVIGKLKGKHDIPCPARAGIPDDWD